MNFHLGIFLVGMAFFLGGVLILIGEIKTRKRSTNTVNAEVIGYFSQVDYDGETGAKTTTYHPIMRYCVMGQWYEERNDTCWNKLKYPIGERMDILYDPEHPEKFRFPGEHTSLIASFVGILIGIGVVILAFTLK